MTVPKIVMESIAHLYDYFILYWRVSLTFMTTLECIGDYRSPS
jgi:hypothetical protein